MSMVSRVVHLKKKTRSGAPAQTGSKMEWQSGCHQKEAKLLLPLARQLGAKREVCHVSLREKHTRRVKQATAYRYPRRGGRNGDLGSSP